MLDFFCKRCAFWTFRAPSSLRIDNSNDSATNRGFVFTDNFSDIHSCKIRDQKVHCKGMGCAITSNAELGTGNRETTAQEEREEG